MDEKKFMDKLKRYRNEILEDASDIEDIMNNNNLNELDIKALEKVYEQKMIQILTLDNLERRCNAKTPLVFIEPTVNE